MDTTRASSGHDQTEDPTKVHHPEEEEHHETGASKMFKKVKARAKKFKNSLTKHGNENEQDDVEEDDDESDEQPLEVRRETNAASGTEVSKPLRDTSYGHEAFSPPAREAPSPPQRVSDLSDREEIRDEPLKTPVYETQDLGGHKKVEADPARGLDYESKAGYGEAGVTEIAESFGRVKVTDDDHKSGAGFEGDLPTRSHEPSQKTESGYSSTGFEGQSGTELSEDFQAKSDGFNQEIESRIGKDSVTGEPGTQLREEGSGFGKDKQFSGGNDDVKVETELPTKSHVYGEEKQFSGGNDDVKVETELPTKSHLFGEDKQFSGRNDDAKVETELGRDLPTESHVFGEDKQFPSRNDDVKVESHEQFSPQVSKPKDEFSWKADEPDTEMAGSTEKAVGQHETPVESYEKFSPQLSKPKDESNWKVDEEPNTATSLITDDKAVGQHGTPLRAETPENVLDNDDKFKDTETTEVSKLPLSGGGSELEEDKGVLAAEKRIHGEEDKPSWESPASPLVTDKAVGQDETPPRAESGENVLDQKTEEATLPLSGGGSEVEDKRMAGEKDKALWESLKEERKQGEAVPEEGKGGGGGGMVDMIKGTYTSWFGAGTTEEVKPKSPDSLKDSSSHSLDTTAGTKGSSDSGESGLGVKGGDTGTVPVQKEL